MNIGFCWDWGTWMFGFELHAKGEEIIEGIAPWAAIISFGPLSLIMAGEDE